MGCVERFMEGSAQSNADRALRRGAGHTFHYLPFSMGTHCVCGELLENNVLHQGRRTASASALLCSKCKFYW